VKEVLWSIPKARRDTEEFTLFKRKLISLVVLNFIVLTVSSILFATSVMDLEGLKFGKLHFSIMAISPVYISFNILEMLQKFIHGPEQHRLSIVRELSSVPMDDGFEGSPSQLGDVSGMHESDFIDSDAKSELGGSNTRAKWFTGGGGKSTRA
jgi:hypothetical protein